MTKIKRFVNFSFVWLVLTIIAEFIYCYVLDTNSSFNLSRMISDTVSGITAAGIFLHGDF